MQWNSGLHAGFSVNHPWIKLNPNYREINVEEALDNPNSIFHYYKELIALRKENDILIYGTYIPLLENNETFFVYKRVLNNIAWLIVINFTATKAIFPFVDLQLKSELQLLISSYPTTKNYFQPFEARVYLL